MMTEQIALATSTEPGSLGVLHLKRYWDKNRLLRAEKLAPDALADEWNIDTTLLSVLGLGLEQTITWL